MYIGIHTRAPELAVQHVTDTNEVYISYIHVLDTLTHTRTHTHTHTHTHKQRHTHHTPTYTLTHTHIHCINKRKK